MDITLSTGTVLSFTCYAYAIIALLFTSRPHQSVTFALFTSATIATSYMFDLLELRGVAAVIMLWGLSYLTTFNLGRIGKVIWTLLVLTSLALAFHAIPGFKNELLFGPSQLGQSQLEYTLYAKMDKALAGLLLLAAFRPNLNTQITHITLSEDIRRLLIGIAIIFGTGLMLGVRFDPKFGELSLAFLFFNLLVTCLAEEAFFRLVIQEGLEKLVRHRFRAEIALILSAIIFALAHFHTGPGAAERLSLIFLAGLTYAWIYAGNRSYVSAVLAHFSINFIHLNFFVYPATF